VSNSTIVSFNFFVHYLINSDIEIVPYYAGHVLGAAMFLVRVGHLSVLYTGDYNMTPDRHLGAAWTDKCRPTVLITESTYATTVRDSKKARERDFLKKVHDCVMGGGKVLIPVFALGRAQELCILIESYWERMGLTVPVYFSAGNHIIIMIIQFLLAMYNSSFPTPIYLFVGHSSSTYGFIFRYDAESEQLLSLVHCVDESKVEEDVHGEVYILE
jgi:Cft2 family RNA processing exonuclease